MEYLEFLATKQHKVGDCGKIIDRKLIHPKLFDWQKDITLWSLKKGLSAVFLDTGLGKTYISLEWARLMGENTLIVAPLSVARQTVRMAHEIDLEVKYVRSQSEVIGDNKLWITNYEMIDSFDYSKFGAIVLDESSILKSVGGHIRQRITELCSGIKYKLCCTATPAPNDYIELGNHTEFLGICKMSEMLATFFINANKEHTIEIEGKMYRKKGSNKNGTEWRLKHHAEKTFFQWLSSWAITMTKPSDLGYDDDGFILPELKITPIFISSDYKPTDQLFFTELHGIGDRAKIRKDTILPKLKECVNIITSNLIYEDRLCHSQIKNIDTHIILPIEINCANNLKNGMIEERQNKLNETNNINTNTTLNIRGNTCEQQNKIINGMTDGENDMLMIQHIGKTNLKHVNNGTVKTEGKNGYQNTDLPENPMMPSLINKKGSVQSVVQQVQVKEIDGELSTLTMTMQRALSVDCYAPVVISESENSKIVQNYSEKQLNILNNKWVVWCGLDAEQHLLENIFGDYCVSVYGSLTPDEKEKRESEWREGNVPIMLTKTKIFGFGMNWQHCHNMIFFGLNDSWESYYQAIRREWRYGQKEPVNVYLILHDVETEIYQNVMRKDAMARRLKASLIEQIRDYEKGELGSDTQIKSEYKTETVKGENFIAMLGDSCERLKELSDNCIDMSVFSPPFAELFTYSASERDLGNSRDWTEFFSHFKFIIKELIRVTKPGRLACVHTSDIPAMAQKDGYIGIKDFPGEVIRAFEKEGWVLHGRCFVPKNPQSQAIRTHSSALLFVSLRRDSSDSRPALIDQILLFKKDGENDCPVLPVKNGDIDNETWIKWANGVWDGIRETDTLQFANARAADDEKHVAPLQLATIERCVKLYSNPKETILTPFLGIGSEAYVALKFGRKAIGIELKPEYFKVAVENLKFAELMANVKDMFSQNGVVVG